MSSNELSFKNVMVIFLITLVVLLLKRMFCLPSLQKDPVRMMTGDTTGKYYCATGKLRALPQIMEISAVLPSC